MLADEQLIEVIAQILHERRHRAGSAQVCDDCRELAKHIDRLYQVYGAVDR